jgi:hypothetical protein
MSMSPVVVSSHHGTPRRPFLGVERGALIGVVVLAGAVGFGLGLSVRRSSWADTNVTVEVSRGTRALAHDVAPLAQAATPAVAAAPREESSQRAILPAQGDAHGAAPPRLRSESSPARDPESASTPDVGVSSAVPPFDADAAAEEIARLSESVRMCNLTGFGGIATLAVTFSPTGRVTQARVEGPPFAGTEDGSCMALMMRAARVPAFSGEAVTVRRRITMGRP